jgi:hypothetical protein
MHSNIHVSMDGRDGISIHGNLKAFVGILSIKKQQVFTCSPNYLTLQVIQSECLRAIGNNPWRTPTSRLHNILNIKPILVIIHRLCFVLARQSSSRTGPLIHKVSRWHITTHHSR